MPLENGPELAPDKLTVPEAEELVREINDPRLVLDPDHSEYFCITTPTGTHYVQRLRLIPHQQESGAILYVRIEKHLRDLLAESYKTPEKGN
jgi:hypothetical protein